MKKILAEMAEMQGKLWDLKTQLIREYPEVFGGKFLSNPKYMRRFAVREDGLYDNEGNKVAYAVDDYFVCEHREVPGAGFLYFRTEDPDMVISVAYSPDRRRK